MEANKRRRTTMDPTHSNSSPLPEDVILKIISHLSVSTLVSMKMTCRKWQNICIPIIDSRRTAFTTNDGLCIAVRRFCIGYYSPSAFDYYDTTGYTKQLANTYGWPIDNWDVSRLNNFSGVFFQQVSFNEDIHSWNVSNATTMNRMFCNAASFNQNINSWNVANVTDMSGMFYRTNFNNNISSWNTSNAICMQFVFAHSPFNNDISSWNTAQVQTISGMFCKSTAFNQDISNWDTGQVTDMDHLFFEATAFNQNLSTWNTANVTSMHLVFSNATAFFSSRLRLHHGADDILDIDI